MTKEEIILRLKEGNKRFVADKMTNRHQDIKRRLELVEGQNPFAVVLTCADSRVVPEIIFDTGLGELFVVSVAGNIANTSSIASIEYAVAHLNAQVIMVLGHQNCGAVTTAHKGGNHGKNLNHLVSHIAPALETTAANASVDEISRTHAQLTKEKLISTSEIINKAVEIKQTIVLPAFYHLDSGEVEFL